jgi:hypothetical protein
LLFDILGEETFALFRTEKIVNFDIGNVVEAG